MTRILADSLEAAVTNVDILCRDRECKWYSETLEHYVHDHEQMEEIEAEEIAAEMLP